MEFNVDDIPWNIVIFISIFAIVLFYFVFFQSYLTALIYRLFLKVLPHSMHIKFKRFTLSGVSGQILIHGLTFNTLQMSVHIDRIALSVKYWRKIPDFDEDRKNRSRLVAKIDGIRIIIFNQSVENIERIEKFKKLFEEGKTTEEVTEIFKEFFPAPQPYQLSIFMRMILPIRFIIHSLVVSIGNPYLPANLFFSTKKINGYYTMLPREDPQHSLKSLISLTFSEVNFKALPNDNFDKSKLVANSMRKLESRFNKTRSILTVREMNIDYKQDAYGCYIRTDDENSVRCVTAEPKMVIKIDFFDTCLTYGPYIDKVRSAFMRYFMPFLFTNPVIYPESHSRVKYMELFTTFHENTVIEIPFITNQNVAESLYLRIDPKSTINVIVPQSVSSFDENKMEVDCCFFNAKISTSLSNETIIHSDTLYIYYLMVYPEKWYDVYTTKLALDFVNCTTMLAPYHIDFLTQLGTDFSATYPFEVQVDELNRFQPAVYYITLGMYPAMIGLLSQPNPPFEFINNIDGHARTVLLADSVALRIQMPFLEYNSSEKQVSFTAQIRKATVDFLLPDNHIYQFRRGGEYHDFLECMQIDLSGSYQWSTKTGNVHLPMVVKVGTVEGTMTVFSLMSFLSTLTNYTATVKAHPNNEKLNQAFSEWTQPPVQFSDAISHSQITVQLVKLDLKLPYDLYDMSAFVSAKASDVFISMEGHFPFWHMILKAPAITISFIETNFPSEKFFYERMGDQSDKSSQGMIHVDGLLMTMKNCNVRDLRPATVNSLIALDVGEVTGYAACHQIFASLDLFNNLLTLFFSEDTKPVPEVNLDSIYLPSMIRVSLRSISIFVDFGSNGLLSVLLPSGIAVYSDNLIDENAYTNLFVNIPTLDIHHVIDASSNNSKITRNNSKFDNDSENEKEIRKRMKNIKRRSINSGSSEEDDENDGENELGNDSNENDDSGEAKLCSIFRVTTFLSIIRRINYSEPKFDSRRQKEILDELNSNFIDFNSLQTYILPELMKTYKTSLDEEYTLMQSYKMDPNDENKYELTIPEIRFSNQDQYIDADITQDWMHKYMITRFAKHRFFDQTIELDDNGIERFKKRNVDMHIILPEKFNVLLKPEFLTVIGLLFKTMSLPPDSHFLASITRDLVTETSSAVINRTKNMSVHIPGIQLLMVDPLFEIDLSIGKIDIFLENEVQISSQMSLSVSNLSLNVSDKETLENQITLKLPSVQLGKIDSDTSINVSKIDVAVKQTALKVINQALQKMMPLLSDFSLPNAGKRGEQLERLLKNHEDFRKYFKHLKKWQYSTCGNPIVSPKVNALISALYLSYSQQNIHDFVNNYRFYKIPSDPPSYKTSLMMIKIGRFRFALDKSVLEVRINPITLQSKGFQTIANVSVKYIKALLMVELLVFASSIKIPPKPETEFPPQKKKPKANPIKIENESEFIFNITLNTIYASFEFLKLQIHYFTSVINISKHPSLMLSMSKFVLTIGEFAQMVLGGFDVCHTSKLKCGIIHIRPIDIYFSIDLLLNTKECLNLTFLEKLPKKDPVALEKKKAKRKSIAMTISDEMKTKEKNGIISEILFDNSFSLTIDKININAAINNSLTANFVFPGFRGGNDSVGEKSFTFFLYAMIPKLTIPGYVSFPLSNFLLHGAFLSERKEIFLLGMIGEINILSHHKTLTKLASLINDILSRKPKKDDTNKNISAIHNVNANVDVDKNVNLTNLNKLANIKKRDQKKEKKRVSVRSVQHETKRIAEKTGIKITINFFLPQLTMELPEIFSRLVITEPSLSMSYDEQFGFQVEVDKLHLNVFNTTLAVSLNFTKKLNFIMFSIYGLNVVVTTSIMNHIPDLKNFFLLIKAEFSQQENVNTLIKGINHQIQNTVIRKFTESIKSQSAKKEEFEFPTITTTKFLLELHENLVTVKMPNSGDIVLTTPLISLLLEIRKSKMHTKMATAAQFFFHTLRIILDTTERQGDNLSSIECNKATVTAITFMDNVNIDVAIDSFIVSLYPTIPNVVAHILKLLNDARPKIPKEERMKVITPSKKKKLEQRRGSLRHFTPESQLITANFHIVNTAVVLNPVNTKFPVPHVSANVMFEKKSGASSFFRQKLHAHISIDPICASITPQLLKWLSSLVKHSKRATKNSGAFGSSLEEFPKFGEPKTKKPKSPSINKIILDVTIDTKALEISLGCQPSDVQLLFGFKGFSMLYTTKVKGFSFQLSNIFVSTDSIRRNVDLFGSSRLLSFEIPSIVGFINLNSQIFNIKTISIVVSNDKMEDLFTFLKVWVQPITQLMKKGDSPSPSKHKSEMITHDVIHPPKMAGVLAPIRRLSSVGMNIFTADIPRPLHKTQNLVESERLDIPSIKFESHEQDKKPKLKLTLEIGEFNVVFAYSGQHGKLSLGIIPIRLEKDDQSTVLSISTIRLMAAGFVAGEILIEQIIVQLHTFQSGFNFVSMLGNMTCDLKSGEDPMLLFDLKGAMLFFLFVPPIHQILSITVNSPQLRMIAQAVSKFQSLLKSIIEPIKIGLAQTKRSTKQKVTKPPKQKINIEKAKLNLLIEKLQVELFRYYITDKEAVRVTVNGASMLMSVLGKSASTTRNMKFTFHPMALSRLTCDNGRVTDDRNVLSIPKISGDLNTLQKDEKVEYDFITVFNDSVETSLSLGDYEIVMAVVKFALSQLKSGNADIVLDDEKNNKFKKGKYDENSDTADEFDIENEEMNKKKQKVKLTFVPGKYDFAPQFKISLGARITPNVEWVLTRLGIADEHIIPSMLFEYVCLGLQKVLEGLAQSVYNEGKRENENLRLEK